MSGGKPKLQNRLWLARSRRDLKQKQVTYLLGHKNLDQVSRYENGSRLPTLQTALKLEIILGVPIRALFPELHATLRSEIRGRASASRGLREKLGDMFVDDHCSYEGLLVDANVPMSVREKIHHHAAILINTMNRMPEDPTREGGSSE
jgi:transcriptional regulator with XRE-family HTH domain